MEVIGQRFIFDEYRAVYVCVARYNEYVNFRMKMSLRFIHLPARRYASAGNSDRNVSVCLSVCLSVRHAPVLCQNEES